MRQPMKLTICPLLLMSTLTLGCGSGASSASGDETTDAATDTAADASPPDTGVDTAAPDVGTVARVLHPTHALEDTSNNPSIPANLPPYVSGGYGDFEWLPGEPHTARTLDGSAVPAWGANPKMLLRFVHLSDLQVADDESPARVADTDSKGQTNAALRPQDAYMCQLLNAAVRTIDGLNKLVPIQFVVLGGDNVDSAQNNELDWVLGILNGGHSVQCDSGVHDDLVPGPGNDPKDPFDPPGLDMPWWWVSGNHDELVQGNLMVGGTLAAASPATGTFSTLGTRSYANAQHLGLIVHTGIVADARREQMHTTTLMSRIAAMGDGHGIGAAQVTRGKGYYHFDVDGTPLRFVVLDSAADTGGAGGIIHRADVDQFVKPALDEAKALGKSVILVSHHAVSTLTSDGGTFGSTQSDAMLADDWKSFVGAYGNVLFSMVGHNHAHDVNQIQPTTGAPWWEVMTASIADFPHQFRLIEIWDGDNGWLMLRATVVDLDMDGDAFGTEARKLGIIDYTTGWSALREPGPPTKRNVELWARKP